MIDESLALELMKARLNRLPGDTSLDGLFVSLIQSSAAELAATGISLDDSTRDLMLVVNTAVWHYQARDSQTGMPDWLRLQRRERWLNERVKKSDP